MRSERVLVGDCLTILPTLDAESVDSIVTDPPYGLGFMGKAWDHAVPGVPFWEAMLRVAKPGAHLAAFGGTRTFHRMACAIEDSGWEIRDTLMWVYGSGFPKSHNGQWGGTALKPAWEPIILARKRLTGTVAANFAEHGTGGLNIDGCRVGTEGARNNGRKVDSDIYGKFGPTERVDYGKGRWPANLIHDGSDEVLAGFPETSASPSQLTRPKHRRHDPGNWERKSGDAGVEVVPGQGDSGSAARFFYCAKASKTDRGEGNNHPTVKPTDLMRYLCRLVTPPGGVVLDPFTGSGSTGRGAIAEGFRFVGIELSPEYAAIAEARIRVVQPGLPLEDA